ncbi:MAG: signal peptidase I [Thermoguttaceae bacterium]
MDTSIMETPSSPTETSFSKPRRPWLAAILSLLAGPLGQVYVGRLRRGLFLWLIGLCLNLVLMFFAIGLPIGFFCFILLCLFDLAFVLYLAVDAFLLARRNRHATLKRYQRWWVYVLLYVIFSLGGATFADFLRSSVGDSYVIPTRSMSPTIQPGDRFLVDKRWYNRNRIHRNDVVVFLSEGPGSPTYVQRVAGLPGDEIEIRNEHVFINGAEWDDPHAVFNAPPPFLGEMVNHGPVKVPLGCCYLLGDNRRMSKDSRMVGPIPLSDICGIARLIYWSRERTFPDPDDTRHYVLGPIRWERLGLRLD